MAENDAAKATVAGKMSGWLKGLIGAATGLLSGAVMMYVTGFVNTVIKPAKPIANFAVDLQGLTVTFHNRSTTKDEGWWDFGDGSPLEQALAGEETISHTYTKPGTYTAKLSLRNLLNEENERSVTINLSEGPNNDPPAILSLEAIPMSRDSYAPATFRLISKVKNADLCVWDLGEDRPLQFVTDVANDNERLVTFNEPGGYVIKLAGVNGKQATERTEIINVDAPPPGMATAILNVTDQAMRVEKVQDEVNLTESFTTANGNVQPINRQVPARQGFEISNATFQVLAGQQAGQKLQVQVASDRHSARMTGELVRSTSVLTKNQPVPNLTVKVLLNEERRTPVRRPATPVTTTMQAPGSTLLTLPPVPADWADVRRQFHLELRDGNQIIWQDSQLPRNAQVTLQKRHCILSATQVGEQVRINLVETKPGTLPSPN